MLVEQVVSSVINTDFIVHLDITVCLLDPQVITALPNVKINLLVHLISKLSVIQLESLYPSSTFRIFFIKIVCT